MPIFAPISPRFQRPDEIAMTRVVNTTPRIPECAEDFLIDALVPYERVIIPRNTPRGFVDVYGQPEPDAARYAAKVAKALQARVAFVHTNSRGAHVRLRMDG